LLPLRPQAFVAALLKLQCDVGGRVAYPKLQYIDHNPRLDLATFKFPKNSWYELNKAIHTPAGASGRRVNSITCSRCEEE